MRSEAISVVRRMVLSHAAAVAKGEAVRAVIDKSDPKQLKLRVYIGERSVAMAFPADDVDGVLGDAEARRNVEETIRNSISNPR